MTDKLREALENIRSLVEETWGFASTSPRGKENLTEVLNLLDLLCAPSAGPPAPIAGVTAIYCGWGCSCVTQCGDTYDYAGQPKPPLRPAAPAQPPAALETCQNCGDLPYPGCSSEFQGEPSCRFWPAAAPAVEAEPVPAQAAEDDIVQHDGGVIDERVGLAHSAQAAAGEMLPCPFCGGDAMFGACEVETNDEGAEYIECTKCHASTALVFPCKDDAKQPLRDRWNRRAHAMLAAAPKGPAPDGKP